MPAARYWRIVGVKTYGGGDLELGELQLYGSAGRVDVGATLACSHATKSGTLAALGDGDASTGCTFAGEHVRSAGFSFLWSFATDVDAVGIRPGAGADKSKYLERADLEYRDATGAWVRLTSYGRFVWPGPHVLDETPDISDPKFSAVAALLPMNGAAGSTTFTDIKGGIWTPAGGAQISTAHSFFGTGVGTFNGGARITLPSASSPDLTTGDFSIEFLARFAVKGVYHVMVNKGFATGAFAYQVWVTNDNTFGFRGADATTSVTLNILGGSMSTGVDYFISARRSGNVFTLHVNNVLIGSQTRAGSLFSDGAPVSIGAYENGVAGLQGYMGQVRISSAAVRSTAVPLAAWPTADTHVGQVFDPIPVATLGQQGAGRLVWSDVGSLVVRRVDGSLVYLDAEAGGAGRVRNTVKEKGAPNLPVRRRVRLVRERDGMVVREQWSDPATGAYDFQFVDERQTYTVLSYDHTLNFRAVIADGLTLANGTVELMP